MPLEEILVQAVDQQIKLLAYQDITFLDPLGRKLKPQSLLFRIMDWFLYRQIKSCFELDK